MESKQSLEPVTSTRFPDFLMDESVVGCPHGHVFAFPTVDKVQEFCPICAGRPGGQVTRGNVKDERVEEAREEAR